MLHITTFMQESRQRRIAYVLSSDLVKVSSLLPSNRGRSLLVHSLVQNLNLLSPATSTQHCLQVIKPRPATVSELCLYHDKDYIDFVLDPSHSTQTSLADNVNLQESLSEYGIEDDCPPFYGLDKYVRYVAGATMTAVTSLIFHDFHIAICWDGGRHHAQKSRASGFCYVADCILAILSLKKAPPILRTLRHSPLNRKSRVMYLDLDLHFSDGVSESFHKSSSGSNPQVLTLSIHHSSPGFFPPSLLADLPSPESTVYDPFTLSLPLLRGASSDTFKRIWKIVEDIREAFMPDYVIVQCGMDGLAGDPCATWNTCIGVEEGDMGWCIQNIVENWECKLLLLGGGGYNSANAARAWAYLTSVAFQRKIGSPLSLETPIPDHSSFSMYSPSFVLEVPKGYMRDENTDEYMCKVEKAFEAVVEDIRGRILPVE